MDASVIAPELSAKISFVLLNSLCIAFLLMMRLNINKNKSERFFFDQRLFEFLIYANIGVLLFDSLMWLIDGKTFTGAIQLNWIISAIYYIFNPLMCMLWFIYCDYMLNGEHVGKSHYYLGVSIPFFVCVAWIISNFWTGGIFYIDAENYYHRSDLYLIMPVLSYSYLLVSVLLIIAKWRPSKSTRDESIKFGTLLFFIIPPFIGSLIQNAYYGISVIWSCTTLSIMFIFINLQNNRITTDYLTGLVNRRQVMAYLNSKIRHPDPDKLIAVIMLDVDNFKAINDIYGHNTGDNALVLTSRILKETCSQNDLPSRFGGDEFVIVLERETISEIEHLIQALRERAKHFSSTPGFEYQLTYSIGYAVWNATETGDDEGENAERLLDRADRSMYEQKLNKPPYPYKAGIKPIR